MHIQYQAPPVKGGKPKPPPRPNGATEQKSNGYAPRGRTGSVHQKPNVRDPFAAKDKPAEDFASKLARLRAV